MIFNLKRWKRVSSYKYNTIYSFYVIIPDVETLFVNMYYCCIVMRDVHGGEDTRTHAHRIAPDMAAGGCAIGQKHKCGHHNARSNVVISASHPPTPSIRIPSIILMFNNNSFVRTVQSGVEPGVLLTRIC